MRLAAVVAILFLCLSPIFSQESFQFTPYATDGSAALSAAAADFDRDGYPDIAVVDSASSGSGGTVDIFFNDHQGGLGTFTSYAIPSSGNILAVDLNGDGWPDLLI